MEGWWAASYIALWLLVVGLCVVVVALARQIGTLHLRLGPRGALEIDDEGPTLDEGVVPIEAADLDGRKITIGGHGSAQLLVFVSPGCRMCNVILGSLRAASEAANTAPLVITDLDAEETRLQFARRRLPAPVAASVEAFEAYSVPGTPYLVVTDDMGIVRAKGTVNNLEQMEGLIETATNRAGDAERRAS